MLDDLPAVLRAAQVMEQLAAVEHERWSHWQRYLHSQCVPAGDGSLIIPAALVARWTEQMSTAYADLTEAEKESDREQVRKYLSVIGSVLRSTGR
ncbi:hypothetical protein ACGFIR_30395 [Micromonospora sp. NPDC049051]|uniref:hypothetical protein n=1 Tax=Micromonospora sp. NPDC049051 TaxID=3364264 RepID=UPI00371CF055